MNASKKLIGQERRAHLLSWLKAADSPIKGTALAERAGVSRQIIVQDISLLKAKEEPIIATSQGYIYLEQQREIPRYQRIIACHHTREQTAEELNCIVDQGVTVTNVIVEHPVYGDLKASIMVSNRREVAQFVEQISATNATYLLELTDGVHLHTLEADHEEQLTAAYQQLKQRGMIIDYY